MWLQNSRKHLVTGIAAGAVVLSAWQSTSHGADLFEIFKRPFASEGSKPESTSEERVKNAAFAGELAKGRMHERAGEWEKARTVYEAMVKRFPDQAESFHRLGVVADQQRRFGEAQQLFTEALRLRPRDPEIHNDLGYCFFLQGQLDKAVSSILKAIQIDPKNSRFHNNLGLVLGHRGNFPEAFAEFSKAGSEADAYYNLAFIYSAQENTEKAKECFRRSLAIDPKHTAARKALQSFELFDAGGNSLRDSEIATNGTRLVPYLESSDISRASPSGNARPMVDSSVKPTAHQETAQPRSVNNANGSLQSQARGLQGFNMSSQREAAANNASR